MRADIVHVIATVLQDAAEVVAPIAVQARAGQTFQDLLRTCFSSRGLVMADDDCAVVRVSHARTAHSCARRF
jgi:hypothetical protein